MATRKFLTPEQKVVMIREYLLEKVLVSELGDKHDMSPVSFYSWQRQLCEQGGRRL